MCIRDSHGGDATTPRGFDTYFWLYYILHVRRALQRTLLCCQLTLRDLTNQEPTVHELNEAVESLVSRSSDGERSPLVNKQREMNDMYSIVQVLARDQTHLLTDKYRQVRQLIDWRWLNDYSNRETFRIDLPIDWAIIFHSYPLCESRSCLRCLQSWAIINCIIVMSYFLLGICHGLY